MSAKLSKKEKERLEYNAKEYGLEHLWQAQLLDKLFTGVPANQLPVSLNEHIRAKCKELGGCGEVILTAMAEWMKNNVTQSRQLAVDLGVI